MGVSPAVGRLLVRCVAEHDWTEPLEGVARLADGLDLQAVAAAARFHGVTGCVVHSLGAAGGPAAGTLAHDHQRGVDRHLRALGDLARLAPALDESGVAWIVVKGPVLAERYYARADLRAYNDVDLVVPATSFGRALAAVEAAGARLIDQNWPLLRELRVGELLLRLRHGTLLDLHWHLVNEAPVRDGLRLPMAEMTERARRVQVGPLQLPTLGPTDTLLHLGLHGCLSGGDRLVWLKDIDRAVATDPPCWEEVVGRAWRWGVGPAVARAVRVLGASVPEGVPEALAGGRAWLALSGAADRLTPPERSLGNRSLSRAVSRSSRRDLASSMAELARHLTAAVTGPDPFRRTVATPDKDPESPASSYHDRGGAAERHAFLDAVAAEGD
jgi:hypothetical protein